jgi:NAD(P)-dependent dehydrogenase (short-subunit alcohol dehydrogenase family)
MAAVGRLSGRGALVTGSSSGIGRAIALRLATEGAEVLCCDLMAEPRSVDSEEHTEKPTHVEIAEQGGSAQFQAMDVGDERSVEEGFDRAGELESPLRICVLNAGIFTGEASILDEIVENHDRTLRVNERGVWLGCREAARRFVAGGEGGRIVCTASISGLVGLADEAAYCSSKGAVVNLVRAVAVELAPHRINVNAVCPGYVVTPMLRASLDEAKRARIEQQTPWPRLGTPADIAAAVAFLVSDEAEWITGVALPVDGGYTCR